MSCEFQEAVLEKPGIARITRKFYKPVLTDVVLGSPNQKCQGAGICIVVPYQEGVRVRWACPSARAWIRMFAHDRLRMYFWHSDLSVEGVKRFFSGPMFTVDSDYSLPKAVTNLFGLEEFVIKRGRHRLMVSAKYFIVEFSKY